MNAEAPTLAVTADRKFPCRLYPQAAFLHSKIFAVLTAFAGGKRYSFDYLQGVAPRGTGEVTKVSGQTVRSFSAHFSAAVLSSKRAKTLGPLPLI